MRCPLIAGLEDVGRFAVEAPERPALISPDGTPHSYRKLYEDLCAVGMRLHSAGLDKDAVVAVLAPQGMLQVVAIMGALAHCICVPMQPRTTVAEVQEALERIGVTALIATQEFSAESEAALAMGIVVLRANAEMAPTSWRIEEPNVRRTMSRIVPPGTALLMSTSGTTAHARLVPLSTANLNAGVTVRKLHFSLTADDRQLLMTSLCHIIGIENTLAQWLAGGVVIATGGFDASLFTGWLTSLRPTWYACAPAVHQAALEQLETISRGLQTTLRLLVSAGAPLSPEVRVRIESLLKVPVCNDYGMTEANPIALDTSLPGDHIAGSAGRGCGLEIGILHDSGRLLAPGETGEIVVRGTGVFSGYLDDPEANNASFCDGWFRTGDAGWLDPEGNLFIVGRLKEMINRGGEKIAPSEVDAVISSHPAILEAASFAVPHATLGEAVACAVVLRPGFSQVTAVELRRFAAGRLAAFKVPQRICFVDSIPRGELGKPQRWQLTARLQAEQHSTPAPHELFVRRVEHDDDDVFYKLYEIWARILRRNDLGFEEDFFEAGGDSLLAMQMLAEVDERFGSATASRAADFLDEPTLACLTGLVGKPHFPAITDGSSDMQIFTVRAGAAQRTLFCVPADKEEGLNFRRLATHLGSSFNLSIVRPGNTIHSTNLFTFERAGAAMAAVVRAAQSEGPYFLAGYCYGGTVAVEAARILTEMGQECRVILFDVPMPGWPPLLRYAPVWLRRVHNEWQEAEQPGSFSSLGRRLAWLRAIGSIFTRRVVWASVSTTRSMIKPMQKWRLIASAIDWARQGNLPFYARHTVHAPILHFLCANEHNPMIDEARFGWRSVAACGLREQVLPLDHSNILHESNLPAIANTIEGWSNSTAVPFSERSAFAPLNTA